MLPGGDMNYIRRLQRDKAALEDNLKAVENSLKDLEAYVTSKKFNCGDRLDGYVSTDDVVLRVREALRKGQSAFIETSRTWEEKNPPQPKRPKLCKLCRHRHHKDDSCIIHETDAAAYNCGCYE
jgi:hypothetical protein